MNVSLRIDRVVLDGGLPVSPPQLPELRAAIQAELVKLIGTNGLAPEPLAGAPARRIAPSALTVNAGTTAHQIGVDVGRAVFGSCGGTNHG